jgi:hypothetical protein
MSGEQAGMGSETTCPKRAQNLEYVTGTIGRIKPFLNHRENKAASPDTVKAGVAGCGQVATNEW